MVGKWPVAKYFQDLEQCVALCKTVTEINDDVKSKQSARKDVEYTSTM